MQYNKSIMGSHGQPEAESAVRLHGKADKLVNSKDTVRSAGSYRSIYALRAAANPSTTAAAVHRRGQTDGRTDRRTVYRYIVSGSVSNVR